MSLPPPVSRSLRHTRAIEVQAYARDDGLWDLDARITDVKQIDVTLASGLRPAGTHLHHPQRAGSLNGLEDDQLLIAPW